MSKLAKLTLAAVLAAVLSFFVVLAGYKAYLDTQIGHANPAAASNPGPGYEPESATPYLTTPSSISEAR